MEEIFEVLKLAFVLSSKSDPNPSVINLQKNIKQWYIFLYSVGQTIKGRN